MSADIEKALKAIESFDPASHAYAQVLLKSGKPEDASMAKQVIDRAMALLKAKQDEQAPDIQTIRALIAKHKLTVRDLFKLGSEEGKSFLAGVVKKRKAKASAEAGKAEGGERKAREAAFAYVDNIEKPTMAFVRKGRAGLPEWLEQKLLKKMDAESKAIYTDAKSKGDEKALREAMKPTLEKFKLTKAQIESMGLNFEALTASKAK